MFDPGFFEIMFDNIPFGVYILDEKGVMIYVNSAYIESIGKTKEELINHSVQDFVKRKEIKSCISDVVYREKRRISMLQTANLVSGTKRRLYHQLIVSTPVFDSMGNVTNVIAICTPWDILNNYYMQAVKEGNRLDAELTSNDIPGEYSVVAESEQMKYLLKMSEQIAKTDSSVMIGGDSGTGKEVIANYIHNHSPRSKNGKLIIVNCASLPENLLEAELFGYEKGAFTGAAPGGKKGLMEVAQGGTLFLDEINSMPLALQGKLLRALETKTIQRVGATKTVSVDFRLLSASNENLLDAVHDKRFRLDLYYRINVIPLIIPPLVERKADIIPLAEFFLNIYNRKFLKEKKFTEHTKEMLYEYDWPGNVRELKNFVERAVVMSAEEYIEMPVMEGLANLETLATSYAGMFMNGNFFGKPSAISHKDSDEFEDGISLQDYVDQCERRYVEYALNKTSSTYEAAQLLKTSQSAIMRKKKKYSL